MRTDRKQELDPADGDRREDESRDGANGSDSDLDPRFAEETDDRDRDTDVEEADEAGELAMQLEEQRDRNLRLHAEFDNFRKRSRRDAAVARTDAVAELVRDLLPIITDLERALDASDENADAVRGGVELVLRGLKDRLARRGVAEIDPLGERFDENVMEAMSLFPSDEIEEGHVVTVIQKGHRIGDRLIEPARVIVSSGPAPLPADGDTTGDGSPAQGGS